MDVQSFLSARLDRGAAPLVVGDLFVLIALLTVGTLNHVPVEYVIANPLHLPGVYAPFVIGWLVVAPLVGAYSAGAAESAKASIPLVIRSWILAAAVGFALREFVFLGGLAPVFVAIVFVTVAIGLGGWRALYFRFRG